MPAVEDLERAVSVLIEYLNGVVDDAVRLAGGMDEIDPATTFQTIRLCKQRLEAVEALLAVVANRSGLTWDAMASSYDVSKQAHHRRLSARGERLSLAAQEGSGIRELQLFHETVASEVASEGA